MSRVTIILEDLPTRPADPPLSIRLRQALKVLLRRYRLRCESLEVNLGRFDSPAARVGGPHSECIRLGVHRGCDAEEEAKP